ncbi:MAG: glycine cleavage system protein H [Pirellulales bacterium]
MSDPLVFMMGEFPAEVPTDRLYARNHMWAQATDGGYLFGFSSYAVRLLQDVYFLDWTVDAGTQLFEKQEIGSIESSKAESDLFAPLGGRLTEFNEALLSDPSTINVDTYGGGWLFKMEGSDETLLTPAAYLDHLEAAWSVAQKTIKGQIK